MKKQMAMLGIAGLAVLSGAAAAAQETRPVEPNRPASRVTPDTWPHDKHDSWIDLAVTGGPNLRGRYVRIRAVNAGQWLFVDEVLVNPTNR